MALVSCPECKKEISDKSDNCVNCGFPLIIEVDNNIKVSDKQTTTKKLPNLAKMKLKDYLLLPFILNIVMFIIGAVFFSGGGGIDLMSRTNYLGFGLIAILFNLPLFIIAINWKNKEIKWYFRLYFLIFSFFFFFFAYQSIDKHFKVNKDKGGFTTIIKDGKYYTPIKKEGKVEMVEIGG